jgi:hypothetical protein
MAAGFVPEGEASELLTHAKYCGLCAEQFKAAIEDVGESTLDEDLASLNSSTPEWQGSLAHRLSAMRGSGNRIKIVPPPRGLLQSAIWAPSRQRCS